jgi:adenylate kinase
VLDGFPRTVAQAEALDRRLAELETPLDAALNFEVAEEELFRRLAGRSAALHRSDDTEQTIRHRLEVFAVKTKPLVDYYRHRGLLVGVDAVASIERVAARIDGALTALGVAIGGAIVASV